MQYAETLAEIQQEKEALEVELMQAAFKILTDWQNKTGLNVDQIYISVQHLQEIVAKKKSIVTDCTVDIKYEGY